MTDIPYGPNGNLINLVDQPGSCGPTCPCDGNDADGMHWAPGDPVFPPGDPVFPPGASASRQLLGEAHSLLCGTSPAAGLIGGAR